MDDGVAGSKVSGDDRGITSRTNEGYDNGGRGGLVHSQFISISEGGSQSLSVREVSCSSGTGDDVVQQDTGRTVTSWSSDLLQCQVVGSKDGE
jgi:hypothetical protein